MIISVMLHLKMEVEDKEVLETLTSQDLSQIFLKIFLVTLEVEMKEEVEAEKTQTIEDQT